MGLLDHFRPSQKKSADVARERLQIILAHERTERNRPSYLPKLQREILEVEGQPACGRTDRPRE